MPIKPLNSLPRVVMVTNIPAPYRNPVYLRLAKLLGYDNFHVVFCAGREANREWIIDQQGFAHTFLTPHNITWKGRYIHINPEILKVLHQLSPDVIITTGFNPTHLLAFAYAALYRKTHIPMTDGTLTSEQILSSVHRIIRRIVFKYSKAFIGASQGSANLFADYGIKPEQFFQSQLCANNPAFSLQASKERRFDFMFCGRFSPEKNPLFALDVAVGVAQALGRKVSVLLVGSGPLLEQVRAYAATLEPSLETVFSGFVQQDDLPELYFSAKVFLFPSAWDPWGVVANEACAAGQAIMVSPLAGVANELIINNKNGFVLPLSLALWIDKATQLLNDQAQWEKFSAYSQSHVQKYNYAVAAAGIVSAIVSTQKHGKPLPSSVVIVQRRLTDYRVPLFNSLRKQLQQQDIELRLLYSAPAVAERSKQDEGTIAWAEQIPARYFLGHLVCWQPFYAQVRDADLVIVTQENKLICNLWPLFFRRSYRLAFWGHGMNRQATNKDNFLEKFKTLTTKRVDWWFTYTDSGKKTIAKQGFLADRITNLENRIDSSELQAYFDSIQLSELDSLRTELGLGNGPIGLYIGSLYAEKRLDFLLEAGALLAQRVPGFRLIIIGNGPLLTLIEQAADNHDWLFYAGRRMDRDKARFLKLADVILNPGLVGLGILDAFVAGIPIITTDCRIHSPEIDYLRQGENGFITVNTIKSYVAQVEQVLTDPVLAKHLNEGCKKSAKHYTIENMSTHFATGILQALGR